MICGESTFIGTGTQPALRDGTKHTEATTMTSLLSSSDRVAECRIRSMSSLIWTTYHDGRDASWEGEVKEKTADETGFWGTVVL